MWEGRASVVTKLGRYARVRTRSIKPVSDFPSWTGIGAESKMSGTREAAEQISGNVDGHTRRVVTGKASS